MLTKTTATPEPKTGAKFNPLCLINRHRPHDQRANWTGAHYASRCENCRKPIRRVSHGKWISDEAVVPHLARPAFVGR